MITLQLHFVDIPELQVFLEKFPDSKRYIEIKDRENRCRTRKSFTQFEEEHIIANYNCKTTKRIAEELQRTTNSINNYVFKLQQRGLLKKKRNISSKVKTY